MKITLKEKKNIVGKFRDFLSKEFGLYVTAINGEKIDVQKKFNEFVKTEFNYDKE